MAQHGTRKITNQGRRNRVVGKFMSAKMKRAIWWESQFERDYCYILEHDRDVIAYRSQPITISYSFENCVYKHTPDFEIIRHSLVLPQYAEIKPDDNAIKEDFIRLHRARCAFFHERGNEYILCTGSHLREGHRLRNIKLLYRYARASLDPVLLNRLRDIIPANSRLSMLEFAERCGTQGADICFCYALIYHGEITIDLDSPIQPDMQVTTTWSAQESLP